MSIASIFNAIRPRYSELQGQVAIITGSGRNIGQGIAIRLAREGMKVVITSNVLEEITQTAAELSALGVQAVPIAADLSQDTEVDRLFSEAMNAFGALHLLVNNAADLRRGSFFEIGLEYLENQVNVNIKGAYRCAFRAAQIMTGVQKGNIVNISSVGGLRGHRRGLPYDLTKGAVDAMTRSMALELAPFGIRVNAVAPGATMRETVTPAQKFHKHNIIKRIPLGRLGTPQDYGAAVAFLVSDEASYITGQVVYVDGGITAQLSPAGQDV
jgi:NAD(P)-dependent dehydrogenase (short-subunit alcohol dehydrogenase family)